MKQIDIKRKENRADFHIKQRDDLIKHLQEQLVLRDKLIKDQFGQSISNFLPAKDRSLSPGKEGSEDRKRMPVDALGATLYKTQTLEQEPEILTMQDIDAMARNINIPGLMMT
jgi:hypothetical protein